MDATTDMIHSQYDSDRTTAKIAARATIALLCAERGTQIRLLDYLYYTGDAATHNGHCMNSCEFNKVKSSQVLTPQSCKEQGARIKKGGGMPRIIFRSHPVKYQRYNEW